MKENYKIIAKELNLKNNHVKRMVLYEGGDY